MENLKKGNLEIVFQEGQKNFLTWLGKSDDENPSSGLNPYLNQIVDVTKGKEIEIDFSKLEYINSSTVPVIISLIKNLNTNKINAVLYYNNTSEWQISSFRALEKIVKTLSNINIIGK